MEQMYLVEIFIDAVTIFVSDSEESSGANKKLIIKIKFGPKVQFIIKECQLALNDDVDDIIECDDQGKRKWTRIIRVGKSYLFPSFPDTVMSILSKFPLEIEVWNDDENEIEIFVGIGTMQWETEFFHMLKETSDTCKMHEPLAIKQKTPLFAECCCRQCGEITFILRLSALGESIITEFQQLMKDPDAFVFRTNKAPSMFQCKRVEGDDPNFCMVGSLYETTTLEDPDILDQANKKIEVCTELQSCAMGAPGTDYPCGSGGGTETGGTKKKKYPIQKIRMGDITGPCGNANCALAHKVRTYIRNLDTYKAVAGTVSGTKTDPKNVCGSCVCKDDRWHRAECSESEKPSKAICGGCGGTTKPGDTCEDKKQEFFGTGATPKGSNAQVAFVFSVTSVPDFKSVFSNNYIVENCYDTSYFRSDETNRPTTSQEPRSSGCRCRGPASSASPAPQYQIPLSNLFSNPCIRAPDYRPSSRTLETNNQFVYNVDMSQSKKKLAVFNCTEIPDDRDCKCSPPKQSPPCKTFDCECIAETSNMASRKSHRAYCPSFKHKSNCPVNARMHNEEEEKKKQDDDEDEAEPLPYGLPPIQLGPCPVMGRPCIAPDGFARMYKTAALAAAPPSYSDAGKVCCSKEYERIKKAIREYMKNEKESDYRCVNTFNVDTEKRCCDKEQVLMSLMGKACCGSHKMAVQEKYKEKK